MKLLKALILTGIPSLCFAGGFSGTTGSTTVLQSSAVAFGSSISTVTSDQNSFVYNDSSFDLHIGTNPYGGFGGFTDNFSGLNVWASPSKSAGLFVWNPNNVGGQTVVLESSIGQPNSSNENLFEINNDNTNLVTFFNFQNATSGQYAFKGTSGNTYLTLSGSAITTSKPLQVNSSETVSSAGGLGVTYGVSVGTITASQYLQATNAGSFNLSGAGVNGVVMYQNGNTGFFTSYVGSERNVEIDGANAVITGGNGTSHFSIYPSTGTFDQPFTFSSNVTVSTLTVSGVLFSSLGGSATNGSFQYCSDCTVTTPATCVGVISAACVCTGSGNGAFAKRLNGAWYCN